MAHHYKNQSPQSSPLTLTLLLLMTLTLPTCTAVWPLCPMRGCSPQGCHALISPLPVQPKVNWTWTGPQIDDPSQGRGCSSGIFYVSCATHDGYVTFDTTGKLIWNTTDMTSPYLPILDFLGNAYGSDANTFRVVYYTGDDSNPLNMTVYQSQFGAAISDARDKNIVVTSSAPATPQVLSRLLDGPPFTTLNLSTTVGGIPGTFVPCGNPVFNKSVVYVITQFTPAFKTLPADLAAGSLRLYAIDLTTNTVAWFAELAEPAATIYTGNADVTEAFTMVHNGVIYVNYASPGQQPDRSPTGGAQAATLCAFKDLGNSSELAFSSPSTYGPMAVYDVTQTWTNMTVTGVRPVWVAGRDPALFTAYDPESGQILSNSIDLARLAPKAVGAITSDIMITRQPNHTDVDVLLFATQTLEGRAFVIALEAGLHPTKPRLLWARDVSGHHGGQPGETSTWKVGGQIANIAVADDGGWAFGVACTLVETMATAGSRMHVKVLV